MKLSATSRKKIICVDFDGVLHSYVKPWSGPRNIPDPPVPGAIEWLVRMVDDPRFQVAIYSSRSKYFGGRGAMKKYLRKHIANLASTSSCPRVLADYINEHCPTESWEFAVEYSARVIVSRLEWPVKKPPAFLTIDDRAMRFKGIWPAPDEVAEFRPWNKRGI